MSYENSELVAAPWNAETADPVSCAVTSRFYSSIRRVVMVLLNAD